MIERTYVKVQQFLYSSRIPDVLGGLQNDREFVCRLSGTGARDGMSG